MRINRAVAATGLALCVAMSVSGCASDPKDSSGGSSGDSSNVTLTYWASQQGTSIDNDKEVLGPVLEAFTKKAGITVNLEVIGWTDLQTRIQTAVASGQGPDVVNIGNTWGVSLQATGAFLPFGDAEMEAIGGADKFVDAALKVGGAPGTDPGSVPLYGLAYGLYYNKQMFADAGLTPPTTWEDMVADAKALTDTSKGVYGMTIAAGSYRENAHLTFITSQQNGVELFDTASGKPTLAQDGVADGIMRYLDLMQTAKVVNPSDSQLDSASKAMPQFAKGQAAMTIQQSNADATFVANGMAAGSWGVVPLPAPEGAKSDVGSHVAGINLAVFANTKHKDQALQFVNWMTSSDIQAQLDKPFASLPVLVDGEATFTTDKEESATFLDIYRTKAAPLPLVPGEDQFEQAVGKAMNQMFASVATGSTVTKDDVMEALTTAEGTIH
ncbi:MAG: sugar ABC transporter substrate-binding protein [Propionibacteriaceae bacterium]|nr:sugar ABC transporter substrate-binding protein [Propionibacteriaceae bacterium]